MATLENDNKMFGLFFISSFLFILGLDLRPS